MKTISTLFLLLITFNINAQLNAYGRVSSIASTTLNISVSDETYASFAAGNQVIVMQMQGNVIGSNTNDDANFGNLTSIGSVGFYEVAIISSVVRSGGAVTQIIINSPLAQTFTTGTRYTVQVISYPLLGSGVYTTTSNITAVPWNGSLGGVVAFRVAGTLNLNHNISADNAGFRGGSINSGTAGSCDNTTYRTAINDLNGNKGEGIYRATNASYLAGRARLLNGGGGGNSHNGGGGGGSNMSAGGEGGKGYNCSSNAGGLGGVTLGLYTTATRIFMGGGGGAGEANNGYNTAGGNGGGVVIINATQITTSGAGAALKISANGQTAANVGNDGAGGGGAAGSVLLNVQTWNIAASKPLTISANGGYGGNVTDASAHGGGAGGGQGAVFFSSAIPTTNITTTTLNGRGGRNYAGGTFADNAVGSDNVGIFNSSFAVLPVKLLSFKGIRTENDILLEWNTNYEENLNRYEVQRSIDGINYVTIANVKVKPDNSASQTYYYNDVSLKKNVYYRLRMFDNNGNSEFSSVVVIKLKKEPEISVSLVPNPVRENASLNIKSKEMTTGSLRIVNSFGTIVGTKNFYLVKGDNKIQLHNDTRMITGTYQVFITVNNNSTVVKMLVQK